jgi:hypothetical protein
MRDLRPWMQAILSLMLMIAALYVLMIGSNDEHQQQWATGAIGIVTTFWLATRGK